MEYNSGGCVHKYCCLQPDPNYWVTFSICCVLGLRGEVTCCRVVAAIARGHSVTAAVSTLHWGSSLLAASCGGRGSGRGHMSRPPRPVWRQGRGHCACAAASVHTGTRGWHRARLACTLAAGHSPGHTQPLHTAQPRRARLPEQGAGDKTN